MLNGKIYVTLLETDMEKKNLKEEDELLEEVNLVKSLKID